MVDDPKRTWKAEAQPRSIHERRRTYTSGEIQNVAFDLFAERGFEAVTVDEIADAAGISPRTFFRYFATKEEVLSRYVDSRSENLLAELCQRPQEEDAVISLREAFCTTSHVDPRDRPTLLRRYRVLIRERPIRSRSHAAWTDPDGPLVGEVQRRMGGGRAGELRAHIVVTAMHSVAAAAFERWVRGGGRGDPSTQVGRALHVLEQGLAPTVGK